MVSDPDIAEAASAAGWGAGGGRLSGGGRPRRRRRGQRHRDRGGRPAPRSLAWRGHAGELADAATPISPGSRRRPGRTPEPRRRRSSVHAGRRARPPWGVGAEAGAPRPPDGADPAPAPGSLPYRAACPAPAAHSGRAAGGSSSPSSSWWCWSWRYRRVSPSSTRPSTTWATYDGIVALYRGLPGELLGIELSSVVELGDGRLRLAGPYQQERVDAHDLISKEEGQSFLRALARSSESAQPRTRLSHPGADPHHSGVRPGLHARSPRRSPGRRSPTGRSSWCCSLIAHVGRRFLAPYADPYLLPVTALLSTLGIVVLYRLNENLALKQAMWLVVGLVGVPAGAGRSCATSDCCASYRYLIGIAGLLAPAAHRRPRPGDQRSPALGGHGPGPLPAGGIRQDLARHLLRRLPGGHPGGAHREHPPGTGRAAAAVPLSGAAAHHLGAVHGPHDLHEGPGHQSALLRGAAGPPLRGHRARLLRAGGPGAVLGRGDRCSTSSSPTCRPASTSGSNPWKDPSGKGYQIVQSLFALAAGGLFGRGLGQGYLILQSGNTIIPAPGDRLHLLGHRGGAGAGGRRRHHPALPDLHLPGLPHRGAQPGTTSRGCWPPGSPASSPCRPSSSWAESSSSSRSPASPCRS